MGRVIVVGSITQDIVTIGDRLPGVGETIFGDSLGYFPGGKGSNQAIAAARQEADVMMVGCVGDDTNGINMLDFLRSESVNVDQVNVLDDVPTGIALIFVGRGENMIMVVPGANDNVTDAAVDNVVFESDDVVVAQYETPLSVTAKVFAKAQKVGARTVLNAAPAQPLTDEMQDVTDVLIVNEVELAQSLYGADAKVETEDKQRIIDMTRDLSNAGNNQVIATLGPKGFVSVVDEKLSEASGHSVEAIDSTGAGDCYVGVFAANLAAGGSSIEAMRRANAAAALSVTKQGAGSSMPTKTEIDEYLTKS